MIQETLTVSASNLLRFEVLIFFFFVVGAVNTPFALVVPSMFVCLAESLLVPEATTTRRSRKFSPPPPPALVPPPPIMANTVCWYTHQRSIASFKAALSLANYRVYARSITTGNYRFTYNCAESEKKYTLARHAAHREG